MGNRATLTGGVIKVTILNSKEFFFMELYKLSVKSLPSCNKMVCAKNLGKKKILIEELI